MCSQDPTLGGCPRDSDVTWDVAISSCPTLFPITVPFLSRGSHEEGGKGTSDDGYYRRIFPQKHRGSMQDEYGARLVPREDWMLQRDRGRRDMRRG